MSNQQNVNYFIYKNVILALAKTWVERIYLSGILSDILFNDLFTCEVGEQCPGECKDEEASGQVDQRRQWLNQPATLDPNFPGKQALFRHNETTEKVLAKSLVIPWNNFWYFLCSNKTLNLCQDKMRLISSSFHVLARLLIFFICQITVPSRSNFSTIIPSLMSWY